MTKMKKKYQRPEMELITTEPFYLLEGSKKSGYAIDNDNEKEKDVIEGDKLPHDVNIWGDDDEYGGFLDLD